MWVQRSLLVLVTVEFLSLGTYMYHSHMEMKKESQEARKQATYFQAVVHTTRYCYEQMTAFIDVLENLVRKQDDKTITKHVYAGLGSLMGLGRGKQKSTGKEAFNFAQCQKHMSQIVGRTAEEEKSNH